MPEVVSEETWEHRIEQRRRCIDAVKVTKEYECVRMKGVQRDIRGSVDEEPLTPDATDRTMSKRQWKQVVADWRKALGKCYLHDIEHASTVTTQDLQSLPDSVVSLDTQ